MVKKCSEIPEINEYYKKYNYYCVDPTNLNLTLSYGTIDMNWLEIGIYKCNDKTKNENIECKTD